MVKENFLLEIKQKFSAPIKKVFDAWTDPKQVAQWYGPEGFTNEVHKFEFKVGGKYRITMTGPKGEKHTVVGEFKEINQPKKLVYTWAWEGVAGDPTLVVVEFFENGRATEMLFRHTGFVETADRDNHNKGWESSFTKLASLLR